MAAPDAPIDISRECSCSSNACNIKVMISAESKEELLVKVKTWKTEMEKKGLRVNMGKTKIMESCINLDVLKKS